LRGGKGCDPFPGWGPESLIRARGGDDLPGKSLAQPRLPRLMPGGGFQVPLGRHLHLQEKQVKRLFVRWSSLKNGDRRLYSSP
jgi:hypothetical protein